MEARKRFFWNQDKRYLLFREINLLRKQVSKMELEVMEDV
jgi:hypothetical protein